MKSCPILHVKRLEKPETLRFSHEKSRCGLPPTNVNGRCRKFEEPKRIYAFGRRAEDNSSDVKDTYDGLVSGHEYIVTSKVKLKEAWSEHKTGHECNVERIRTETGKETAKVKLEREEENDEASEEISSPLKTKLDACVSVIEEISSSLKTKLDACSAVTEEISSSLKTNLDACISVIEGNVVKEKSQDGNCEKIEMNRKTEKEFQIQDLTSENELITNDTLYFFHFMWFRDRCLLLCTCECNPTSNNNNNIF